MMISSRERVLLSGCVLRLANLPASFCPASLTIGYLYLILTFTLLYVTLSVGRKSSSEFPHITAACSTTAVTDIQTMETCVCRGQSQFRIWTDRHQTAECSTAAVDLRYWRRAGGGRLHRLAVQLVATEEFFEVAGKRYRSTNAQLGSMGAVPSPFVFATTYSRKTRSKRASPGPNA